MAPGFLLGTTEWVAVSFPDTEYLKIEKCG